MAASFAKRVLIPTYRCLTSATLIKQSLPVSQVRYLSTSKNLEAKYFSKDHEWVEVEGQTGVVGISDYAQEKLGEIVYVETPEKGAVIEFEDIVGCLESVKAASDIISPVQGTVTEVNTELADQPGLVNTSPLDKGWLFKVTVTGDLKTDELMDEAAYVEYIKTDAH